MRIDRGLIDNDFEGSNERPNQKGKSDLMAQLREFKIGLRPYEEFYFDENGQNPPAQANNPGSMVSSLSPDFGGNVFKNRLKNSVINMNNYVS